MRAVVQRVSKASVSVDGETVGAIDRGLMVLLGVGKNDNEEDAVYLSRKIAGLRIFEDDKNKMNLSVSDIGGSVLAVSQFTLWGDCRHGRRPGFTEAAQPESALILFNYFLDRLRQLGLAVQTGKFQSHMQVNIVNDGPVTILLDSTKHF